MGRPGSASGCLDAVPGPNAPGCCVFYGWVVLLVSVAVRVVGSAGTLRNIAFIVPAMMADPLIDMSSSELSTLFSIGTFVGALGAPYLGMMIDLYGARTCLPAGCVLAALGVVVLSSAVTPASIALGFLLVRMFCLGGILQWAVVPISHWFDKRRGQAQSYLIVGGTLITSVLWFPIFERLIEAYGWRVAMRCCAVALVAVALPAAVLVYHDPESVGCVADGDDESLADGGLAEDKTDLLVPSPSKRKTTSAVGIAGAEGYTSTRSFTLHDAMQSAPFYVLCADQVSGCILGAGVFFHLIPVLEENGGGAIDVALAFTMPMGICEAVSSLVIGRLIDRQLPPRYIVGTTNFMQFAITLTFPFVNTTSRAVAMGVARGFYQGLSQGVQVTVIPSYYGREHLGRIQGVLRGLAIAGTAVGPLLLGLGHDHYGAFAPVLMRFAVLPAAIGFAAQAFLQRPVHPREATAAAAAATFARGNEHSTPLYGTNDGQDR